MFKLYFLFISLILLTACSENNKINITKACNPNSEYLSDLDLYAIDNIEEAKTCSKELNKPILTIYSPLQHSTDWVRKMFKDNKEESEIIYKNYILVILNVDTKIELEKPVVSQIKNHLITTIGELNSEREIVRYKMVTQPLFAITNYRDEDVAKFQTYRSLQENSFLDFLKKGLIAFDEKSFNNKKPLIKLEYLNKHSSDLRIYSGTKKHLTLVNSKSNISVAEIKDYNYLEKTFPMKMNFDTVFVSISNDTLKITTVFFSVGYCNRTFIPSYKHENGNTYIISPEIIEGTVQISEKDTTISIIGCELAGLMNFEYRLPLSELTNTDKLFFRDKEIQFCD